MGRVVLAICPRQTKLDDVSGKLVTRRKLQEWGFRRTPDLWIPCPVEGRRKYFERWYHAGWNFTSVIGWIEHDPLKLREEDFIALVQVYLIEDAEKIGRWPWDEVPSRGAERANLRESEA